jgi:hypothetical protein
VKEIGVRWCNDPDSRVRPLRDGTKMLLSMMAIRQRVVRLAADGGGGGAVRNSKLRVQN